MFVRLVFYAKLGVMRCINAGGDLAIGWMIIPLFAFAVVATGNAVNISDGLDGLAGGLLAISFVTFGGTAPLQGSVCWRDFALRWLVRC